jgi:ADP-ribosylglycohydrolase
LELEEVLQPNEDVALLNNKHLLCEEEHKEVVLVVAAAIVLVLILELVRAQHIAVVVRRAMMLSIIEQDRIFSLSTSSLF